VADILLFHSAYGLRPAVLEAAERLRRAGHRVETPDLYRGAIASTLEVALALRDRIGRPALLEQARACAARARPDTVLAGFSMGAALAQRVAARDSRFSRLLLFHGVAELPPKLPARWQVQAHLAEADPLEPREEVVAWRDALRALGAAVDLHFYRGGHLFTDPGLPDHDAASDAEAWARAGRFLAG